MQFRKQHESELLNNPDRCEELSRLIEAADQIRSTAAVEGYSSQRVYWVPEVTVFNKYGQWVKLALVAALILFNVLEGLGRSRCFKDFQQSDVHS